MAAVTNALDVVLFLIVCSGGDDAVVAVADAAAVDDPAAVIDAVVDLNLSCFSFHFMGISFVVDFHQKFESIPECSKNDFFNFFRFFSWTLLHFFVSDEHCL